MRIIDKNISKIICDYDSGNTIPDIRSFQLAELDRHSLVFELGLQVLPPSVCESNLNIACFSCCIGISSFGLDHINTQYTVTFTPTDNLDNEKIIYTYNKCIKCYGMQDSHNEYVSFSFDTKNIYESIPANYYRVRLYACCVDSLHTNKAKISNMGIFEGIIYNYHETDKHNFGQIIEKYKSDDNTAPYVPNYSGSIIFSRTIESDKPIYKVEVDGPLSSYVMIPQIDESDTSFIFVMKDMTEYEIVPFASIGTYDVPGYARIPTINIFGGKRLFYISVGMICNDVTNNLITLGDLLNPIGRYTPTSITINVALSAYRNSNK